MTKMIWKGKYTKTIYRHDIPIKCFEEVRDIHGESSIWTLIEEELP